MHCNIAKAPAFPILAKFSHFGTAGERRLRIVGSENWTKIWRFWCSGSRFLSTSEAAVGNGHGSGAGSSLPWLTAQGGEKRGKESVKASSLGGKSKTSSWVEAAENFLARNDEEAEGKSNKRNVRGLNDKEIGEDAEVVNDPRWSKIKQRLDAIEPRLVKRQAQSWKNNGRLGVRGLKGPVGSRFAKPEVQRWSKEMNWGRGALKEAVESLVPKMVGQSVYGVGPVLAALTAKRREFYALYVQEGMDLGGNNKKKKDKKAVEKVMQIADSIGLKVVETSKHDLNMIVDNRPHQGLVLDATPLEMVNVREMDPPAEGQKATLWLALDEVTDPHNLGAIIRSAYFFGAEGVVLCAKNSAPLSGVVSKASAGSLELIELMSCKNMMQFLSSSADNGWRVLGGSMSRRAVSLSEVEAGVPTILALGSEGHGLRPLVERSCTQLIRIPGNIPVNAYDATGDADSSENDQNTSEKDLKSFIAVESLNVSVAAGVLLYNLIGDNTSES